MRLLLRGGIIFRGNSESTKKIPNTIDEIIIAPEKPPLHYRKDIFAKIAFCCLLTLIFPGANLFVSGVIQLPEFFTAIGPIPGTTGIIALIVSLIRSERWSFFKVASLVLASLFLLFIGLAIFIYLFHGGTPRRYYRIN